MKIAIVIPVLDEAEGIADAVASARAADVEVVVVDGGSTDATRARAEAAGARVIESRPGRARQLEAGVSDTSGDVILFLHADTRLPPDYDRAVRSALTPGVVGGCFRLQFDDRSWPLRLIEWGVRLRVALFSLPYGDQALFVRRSVLEAIDGVPQTPIMEDLDLVSAMRKKGRIAVLPLSVVTSARRYREKGVLRSVLRNTRAWAGWWVGSDRERIAARLGQ